MDENKTVLFQCDTTFTLAALRDVYRANIFHNKLTIALNTVIFLHALSVALPYENSQLGIFYAPLLTALILLQWFSPRSNLEYKRMLSRNEGVPLDQKIVFNSDYITSENPRTGNQNRTHYHQVTGIAKTKDYYILYLEYRQFIQLQADTLTGGTDDEFIRFICSVSPKMKPKKLRSGTFGKVVYSALIVETVLIILGIILRYCGIFPYL